MDNADNKLDRVLDLFRRSLLKMNACRLAAFSAVSNAPQDMKLVDLHHLVQQAELSLLQAQAILFELKVTGSGADKRSKVLSGPRIEEAEEISGQK